MTDRNEKYQGTIDNIISMGLKAMIAEKMGFRAERIYLLEGGEENGLPTWVAFEVNGQGYSWDIRDDHFEVDNAYGDRFFGEDE